MDVVQINAPVYAESIVVTEWDTLYSREAGQMAANQVALQNQVLALVAGAAVPLNFAAADGSQNAAVVALYPSDSSGAVTYIARGPVVLRQDMLVWPVGATNIQIAAALAQLTALGIVSRVTG